MRSDRICRWFANRTSSLYGSMLYHLIFGTVAWRVVRNTMNHCLLVIDLAHQRMGYVTYTTHFNIGKENCFLWMTKVMDFPCYDDCAHRLCFFVIIIRTYEGSRTMVNDGGAPLVDTPAWVD